MKPSLNSKILVISAILILISLFVMGCFGAKEEREQKALAILNDCATWFITNGISGYYKDKDFGEISRYVKEKGANFYHYGIISSENYIARITLDYLWVGSDITCFERIEHDKNIYEYWVVANESKRTDFEYRIHFFVTESECLTRERNIIYQSDKFFSEFSLADGFKLKFPINKIGAIYELRPWNHPKAFSGTELEGIKENDVRRKMGWPLVK